MNRKIRRLFSIVGPGVITGAADDDPSGIATYSQTGAQFGYGQLWMMVLMLPMMICVQEMCARIGLTKGKGIAGVLKDHYPRPVLFILVSLMLIANIINLGADLGAMAAAVRLLFPLPFFALVIAFAGISLVLQIYSSYPIYCRYLKWLAISLFAYVLTAFVAPQDWGQVLRNTFVPHIELNFDFLMILVGLLGTTISPYLFFWQASQEVEEGMEAGRVSENPDEQPECGPVPGVTQRHLKTMRLDTIAGMTFSQVAAWFMMITAAGSLHTSGHLDIATAADAARALEPLVHGFPYSGTIAAAIFAIGIIGLGMLAVPTFAGSAAYALSETFGWRFGLTRRPLAAPQFYAVMLIATILGIAIDLLHINPMKALIYTAVINGVTAVPLILFVLLITRDQGIMGRFVNKAWTNAIGWVTLIAMTIASIAMIVSFAR